MSWRRLPVEIPDEIAAIADDAPEGLFNETFRAACERFDRYIGALVGELARTLELPVGSVLTPELLLSQRGWVDGGALPLRWLLEALHLYGFADASDGGWRLDRLPGGTPDASTIGAAAVQELPGSAPAYRVFDLCASSLGAVLRGERSGESALFSPATLGLWFEYFSNDNPHYAVNNLLAAAALSRVAPPGARLLEVGGGGGSAALAALACLVRDGRTPASYTFTELHPAFLRRGARALQAASPPGCSVTTMRYDIDGEPAAQGLKEREFDAILAVNTLHLGHDLVRVLARLRSLLRPGGALVLGELLRPGATAGVHIELPFTLLEAYRAAPFEAGIRRRPGFLAAEGWRRALAAAGYSEISMLPHAFSRCAKLYPGFYCGAITAIA